MKLERTVEKPADGAAALLRRAVRDGLRLAPLSERPHLVTYMGALLVCFALVLWMVGPFMLALFLGGTLAMLSYPAYHWLLARGRGPRLAATAVTALMLLLVIAPMTGFSILAVRQGIAIGQELSQLQAFSTQAVGEDLSRWDLVKAAVGDPGKVNAKITTALQSAGEFTRAAVVKLGKGIPDLLLQMTLAVIAFFFFLLDGGRFMDWLLGLHALDRDVQLQLVKSFRETTISSVVSGLAAAASLSLMIALGFWALGVPGAFLAGGLTFIFSWIPIIGTSPALLAALLYLYSKGALVKVALLVALGVSTTVVDHAVRPLVLNGRVGMHPLVGLVAIFSGMRMFGILGVFIGPILAAMLLALLRLWPVVSGRLGMQSQEAAP